MVGAAGFEPTTPCPPDKCATGLRYAPTKPVKGSEKNAPLEARNIDGGFAPGNASISIFSKVFSEIDAGAHEKRRRRLFLIILFFPKGFVDFFFQTHKIFK